MSLWLVRAGKHGAEEQIAIDQNVVTIGWNEFPSFSKIKTKNDLTAVYRKEYPDVSKTKAGNEIGQIWRFVQVIKKGDLVALPKSGTRDIGRSIHK